MVSGMAEGSKCFGNRKKETLALGRTEVKVARPGTEVQLGTAGQAAQSHRSWGHWQPQSQLCFRKIILPAAWGGGWKKDNQENDNQLGGDYGVRAGDKR